MMPSFKMIRFIILAAFVILTLMLLTWSKANLHAQEGSVKSITDHRFVKVSLSPTGTGDFVLVIKDTLTGQCRAVVESGNGMSATWPVVCEEKR